MNARFVGKNIGQWRDLPQPGDIAIGAENYHHGLMVNCPVCHDLHVVNIPGGHSGFAWRWDEATLTLTPSVVFTGGRPVRRCHWNLTNGVFVIHADSTAKPQDGSA